MTYIFNNNIYLKYAIYNSDGNMIESEWVSPSLDLDNKISDMDSALSLKGLDNMRYKINRKVIINGKTHNVRAQSEQEYADRLLALYQFDDSIILTKHNFKEYALNWYETYSRPNIAEVTAITYKRQLDKYLFPWFGELNIEDITTDHLQRLFNSMGMLTKATKDKVRIILNQIFESAIDDGYIIKNPLKSNRLKINGASGKETPTYTVGQMQYLVQHIGDIQNETDRLFVALIALHPLRLEETLGLQWEDIDFKNRQISINRAVSHPDRNQPVIKDTKTEKSKRTLGLSNVSADYLSAAKNKTGFIIGGNLPFSYTQVRRMCERIQNDTAFDEKITPRRFRTTVLTDIYDQTKDVRLTQASGGHSNPSTTLRYYVKGRENASVSAQVIDDLYAG